jgi:serine/threonine protein kinase/Flp pilus assembly protein TadD
VGHGGFGEVYRAWDPHLEREVALKLLLPGAVGGETDFEAMLREARALASVRHPNIVPVHGIDRHGGRVGFWTDFVRGKTLSVVLREQGRFGAREAALVGLDVARALCAVHRVGLLHRDIKAENVMREEGGRILLMDFGLSSLQQRQTAISGTPNYMAPELFQGNGGSVATDIYAMGVLLYFLVSGDYPVRLGGVTIGQALEAFTRRKPLIDLRPDMPEGLLRTVATATEMDPAKRFQSAGQLANALAESLGSNVPPEITAASDSRLSKKPSRRLVFGVLLPLAAIAVSLLAWYGHRSRTSHERSNGGSILNSGAADQFQKAQDLLLHSYKEANVARAVKGFETVLKEDPNNALALAELGDAHFVQYRYSRDTSLLDLAIAESERARTINPDLAAPYVTLGRIAAHQGKTQEAMQWVDKAREKEPHSAEVFGALGEVYEAQGKGKDAIGAYIKASEFAPEDWRWPLSLGVAEFMQGNMQESIRQYQNGIKLANDNAVAYYDLSIAHMETNQLNEAQKDLEKSIELDPTARKYGALGSNLLYQGKYDEAVEMQKKSIAMNPNDSDSWANLAAVYAWSGKNPDLARQAAEKAVALRESEYAKGRKDPPFLAALAENYLAVGNPDKSLVLARQAIALDPANPTVQYIAGGIYEKLGQRAKAIPLIASALAQGYRIMQFERDPELASLRADPAFVKRLNEEKAKQKTPL